MTEQQDISFDPEVLEAQPIKADVIELAKDPTVELALKLAEKNIGRECPRLRDFARACQEVREGESRDDRRRRLKYLRGELFG